jgi:hypothetical protein
MAATRLVIRSRAAVAAVAVAALGGSVAWLAQSSQSAPPPIPFWGAVSGVVDEVNPPTSVTDIASRADAIVVAQVTGITEGREAKPYVPEPPGGAPLPHSSYVLLTVDRVVRGAVQPGQVLKLEMEHWPAPLTIASMQESLPAGSFLFFLSNKAMEFQRSGLGASMDPIERELWQPASYTGVIGQDSSGLYDVLHYYPAAEDDAYLRTFQASTVDEAATKAGASLG